MAINNNCLYTAAICGFMEAAMAGRSATGNQNAASFAGLVAAAAAFAAQVDQQIPFDATITTGASNTILAITTNTIAGAEFGKINLMRSVCCGVMWGRFTLDATQADYTAPAGQAAAAYTEGLTVIVTP
jgi:hypothetical protein